MSATRVTAVVATLTLAAIALASPRLSSPPSAARHECAVLIRWNPEAPAQAHVSYMGSGTACHATNQQAMAVAVRRMAEVPTSPPLGESIKMR